MRLTRHIALAAGAVTLTTLSGCGSSSPQAENPPEPTASTPATASAPAAPTAPATPPTSATTSGSASASPGAATTSAAPTVAPVHVTTYSDKTGLLQLPVSNASLPGSPPGLRDFAKTQLTKMWHDQFQGAPGCKGIGQVLVKRTSATAAYVQVSWGATTPTCPQYAGNPGWWEVWGAQGSTWALTLRGEGLASCADLSSHAIRRAIYPTCTDGSKKVPNPVG